METVFIPFPPEVVAWIQEHILPKVMEMPKGKPTVYYQVIPGAYERIVEIMGESI
jgi:hypothetical protein